jgi:hypothetical protein
MKKIISIPVIILFALILALPSCKKDKALDELIIGKWKVQAITQVYYENNVKISEYTLYSFTDVMSVQFVDGGTGIIYENNDIYGAFTWTLSGNKVTIDSGSGGDPTVWDISVDNDILTWSFEESEVVDNVTQKYEYSYSAGKVN